MNERRFLKTGESIMWRLFGYDKEDATAYEVYAITLTGSVELVTVDSQESLQGIVYIGVSKDAQARFQQHLRKDQWLKDAIARGLQASYEVIERVAGILIARERERYWIKHHREEGKLLYNRQSLQKPPTPRHRKQRVKWTQNYLREGRRAYSEYVETMFLWRMRLKEEGFTFDEER